jgi:organic hydroperoxide reductase OsmC/OhrA
VKAKLNAGMASPDGSNGHAPPADEFERVRRGCYSVVPAPYSVVEAVDPEEALVASAASCHMLWFLWIASRRGFVVESYTDKATGIMEKNSEGKLAITRITLRPRIEFSADRAPSAEELQSLHHSAHDECFIANSLKSEVVVEAD